MIAEDTHRQPGDAAACLPLARSVEAGSRAETLESIQVNNSVVGPYNQPRLIDAVQIGGQVDNTGNRIAALQCPGPSGRKRHQENQLFHLRSSKPGGFARGHVSECAQVPPLQGVTSSYLRLLTGLPEA